jgi:hypothetical protein
MTDVDDHRLSTADGHLTLIVLTRSTEMDKVHTVGDRVPQDCIGDPSKRFITLLSFETKHSKPAQMFLRAVARHRLDVEADKLRPRYHEKGLTRDPRKDVYAVLDFDGSVAARMELTPSITFQVVLLGPAGELLARWSDVPSVEALASAMK